MVGVWGSELFLISFDGLYKPRRGARKKGLDRGRGCRVGSRQPPATCRDCECSGVNARMVRCDESYKWGLTYV